MSDWGDNSGRLRFAPHAIQGVSPYVDRVAVTCDDVEIPLAAGVEFADFLEELSRGSLFGNRRGTKISVRSGWLYSGVAFLREHEGGEPRCRLRLELNLNPTRFLQSLGVPNSVERRRAIIADPQRWLRISRGGRDTLEHVREATLDGNTNFVVQPGHRYGQIGDWDVRLREYIQAILYHVGLEVRRVLYRLAGGSMQIRRPVDWTSAIWRLKQVEYYWEFKVPDAVAKIRAVQHSVMSVLLDPEQRRYPPSAGQTRNAPYVQGQLGRAEIKMKLYAKASRIVRLEVSYLQNPLRTVPRNGRRRSPPESPLTSPQSVADAVTYVGLDAHRRAGGFWNAFWRRHGAEGPISSDQLSYFLGCIAEASEDSQLRAGELLNLILLHDGAEPFSPSNGNYCPVRELHRVGILERSPTSSTRRPRYVVKARYHTVVDGLRSISGSREQGTSDTELYPDEEPPPEPRARLRRFVLTD